jgi:hypothetical protein
MQEACWFGPPAGDTKAEPRDPSFETEQYACNPNQGTYKKNSLFWIWVFFSPSQFQVLLSSSCHEGRTHGLIPALNGKSFKL